MLKITIHDSAPELRLRLEGRLCGPWVGELRQCWQTAASTLHGRMMVLDLREVDFVDAEGRSLMAEMRHDGVDLQASTPLIQALIDQISGDRGYGTVEGRPARLPDAFACPDSPRRDPRPL
ncbi:MAG TPA: hypothetical protein VMH81_06375 [Bryobacteraceae bacterium]|nr:hypothetical protein [Bryobacteraceae bacterium]